MNKKKKIKKSNQTNVIDIKKIYKASKDMLEKANSTYGRKYERRI